MVVVIVDGWREALTTEQGHRFLPSLAVARPYRDHCAYNIVLLISSSHHKAAQRSTSPTPWTRRVRPVSRLSRLARSFTHIVFPCASSLPRRRPRISVPTRRAPPLSDPPTPADVDLLTAPASCSVMVVTPPLRDWHSIDT